MSMSLWLWVGFTVFVLLMLALDLGVFHRKAHVVRMKEALAWSIVWVGLAVLFNAGVYFWFGPQKALEFLTGYLIEKTLSVDNVFVFVVLFSSFAVPRAFQHRVLFWGVLGALVMRAIFIGAGAALLQHFHWIIYLFGALLVITAVKLWRQKGEVTDPTHNVLYRLFARRIPSVPEYDGEKFFTIRNGRRYATPLFLVLLAIEATDLVFAVDSIPAIFAITGDPFIEVRLHQAGPCLHPRFRRSEDAAHRSLQNPDRTLARRHLRHPGDRDRRLHPSPADVAKGRPRPRRGAGAMTPPATNAIHRVEARAVGRDGDAHGFA
jgi:tellurite resistance protein TerC